MQTAVYSAINTSTMVFAKNTKRQYCGWTPLSRMYNSIALVALPPWHGTLTDLGDQMVIRFDSKYDSVHHTPVLKAVNLFLSSEREIFHGIDYQGRFVELIPVSMWKFVPPAPNTGDTIGSWALHANFRGRPEGEWVLV